jgi:hypothetical protein
MIKAIIGIVIILVSVVLIGYLVANYFDKSASFQRAMEEAEESQIEILQTLVECRNALMKAGMDPVSCDRRTEQAQQQNQRTPRSIVITLKQRIVCLQRPNGISEWVYGH